MNQDVKQNSPPNLSDLSTVTIGGITKDDLIKKLNQQAIQRNPYAEQLLSSDYFTISPNKRLVHIIKISVKELGYKDGATLIELYEAAKTLGLELCPLELGPFLRLQYLHQDESSLFYPQAKNQAPSGSLTIASTIMIDAEDFPKGFYLRKIGGTLCLRGYRCSDDYRWNKDDCFVFMLSKPNIITFPTY